MDNKKSSQNVVRKIKPKYTVRNALVNYYVLIMFTLFPLFFTNKYFNIRHDKLYFFLILTGFLTAAVFALTLEGSVNENDNNKARQSRLAVLIKNLSFTDLAVIAFLVVSIISTLLSEHPISAFWGESENISSSGRNNGLLLIIFYVTAYFLITRLFHYFEYIFAAFACSAGIVFLLAVLNGFFIDPLNMSEGLSQQDSMRFISTIGNKNMLSSYICIALPVAVAMSVYTKKTALRTLYIAVSGLGFAALMTADSDSGILGIGAFSVIYLIWYSRRPERLKYYFLSVFVMLSSAKLLRLFSIIMNDKGMGMDAYQRFFVYDNTSCILLAVTGIITLMLFVLDAKKPHIVLPKSVPVAIACVAAAAVIGALSIVFYFSVIDTETKLGSLETILRFNDRWGTHRGFMWIRSMRIFGDAPFFQKLFGTGPDTFYYAFSPYFGDLMKFGDTSTNAAHNEYINYLITTGITGLASYLAIVGGAIAGAVKYSKQNPLAVVCASAVICYSVQAVVNIAQPITTPLFVIFTALCESVSRQAKAELIVQ